jgi:hypothetical protein
MAYNVTTLFNGNFSCGIIWEKFMIVKLNLNQNKFKLLSRVQSQSNKPKTMSDDHQNSFKTMILLDMFLWCHFNAMVIMGSCVK